MNQREKLPPLRRFASPKFLSLGKMEKVVRRLFRPVEAN
jgi:hypothetical protein